MFFNKWSRRQTRLWWPSCLSESIVAVRPCWKRHLTCRRFLGEGVRRIFFLWKAIRKWAFPIRPPSGWWCAGWQSDDHASVCVQMKKQNSSTPKTWINWLMKYPFFLKALSMSDICCLGCSGGWTGKWRSPGNGSWRSWLYKPFSFSSVGGSLE